MQTKKTKEEKIQKILVKNSCINIEKFDE